jgi:hypothetical protein
MRRLIAILGATCLLLLTTVAPALAAPGSAARPVKESGTVTGAFASSINCEQQGTNEVCTETWIDLFREPSGTTHVCVLRFTYTVGEGRPRLIGEESGCTEAAPGAFTVQKNLDATLAPTEIQLVSCQGRACRPTETITVSGSFDAGQITTYSGRGQFREGGCIFRFSYTGERAEAIATIVLDGTTLTGSGEVFREDYRVSSTC